MGGLSFLMGGVSFFEKKGEQVAGKVDGLAESKIQRYPGFRDKFYRPGDLTQRQFERSYIKVTTEEDRALRRKELQGENGSENALVRQKELEKLIEARSELQSKLIDLYSSGSDDRADRGKNRVALFGGGTLAWEAFNWMRDLFQANPPECNGEPIPNHKQVEHSTAWTVLQSLVLCYASYKLLLEPSVQNFRNERALLESWVEQYDKEIEELIDDLKEAGHDDVVKFAQSLRALTPKELKERNAQKSGDELHLSRSMTTLN